MKNGRKNFGFFKNGNIQPIIKSALPKKLLRIREWIAGEEGDWKKVFSRNKK
jgi:hypothetical protein